MNDRSELCVDDLQTTLRVATTRMISCQQLQVSIDSVERCADFMCERSSDLTDRRHSFRVQETLLRAYQVSVGCVQFTRSEVNFPHQLIIQTADLTQQLFTLSRSRRNIVHHLIEVAGDFS